MNRSLAPDALTIPRIDALAAARGSEMLSFAGGTPHPDDLPLKQLKRRYDDALTPAALAYGASRGQESLLKAAFEYFAGEGVDASTPRLLITSGAMAGLDLVFRTALEPGDLAIVETPTYSDSLLSLTLARARVAELPMDSEGAQVDELNRVVEEAGVAPKLIYVIPTFHNPAGVTMIHERRIRLIELAEELGALLVEDDAYGAFRFSGPELPSLAALSSDVVSVRSFSKIVAPGLRVGCVIGPPSFIESLAHARGGTDICTSPLNQEVVAGFLASGAVDRHIAGLNRLFAERRDAMIEALEAEFAGLGATWTQPLGGIFIWLCLPEGFDSRALLAPALDEGVAFVPGSVFSIGGEHRNALRLCFASVGIDGIKEGITRLRTALQRLDEHPAPTSE